MTERPGYYVYALGLAKPLLDELRRKLIVSSVLAMETRPASGGAHTSRTMMARRKRRISLSDYAKSHPARAHPERGQLLSPAARPELSEPLRSARSFLDGASSRLDLFGNRSGHLDRILVLPKTESQPARFGQAAVGIRISSAVRLDLVAPPLRVRLRPRCVNGAPVPEAAVDKNGDAGTWEDDVCLPTQAGHRPDMDAKAKAAPMKLGPKRNLWCGIPRDLELHPPACGFGRRHDCGGPWRTTSARRPWSVHRLKVTSGHVDSGWGRRGRTVASLPDESSQMSQC
jgi:hypothetical protein